MGCFNQNFQTLHGASAPNAAPRHTTEKVDAIGSPYVDLDSQGEASQSMLDFFLLVNGKPSSSKSNFRGGGLNYT